MASIITATTTSGLTQSADNSGVLQLASGTGNLVTIPSVTGTAMVSGNMPAFSAYKTGSQTLTSSTYTKILYETEEFDTNSNFASSTFTPTVAGYYQVTAAMQVGAFFTTGNLVIYKNGSSYKKGFATGGVTGTTGIFTVTTLVYCNGSTDYIEAYGILTNSGGQALDTGIDVTYFNGSMIRGA